MAGKKEKEKHRRIIIITIKQQKCKSDAIDENTNNENTNDAMKDSMKEKEDSESKSNVDVSKVLKFLLTVTTPILTIFTVWVRYSYATEVESFYGIEKSLVYSVIGSEVVLSLIQNVYPILLPVCLIFLYFILGKKFSLIFGIFTALISAMFLFMFIQIIEYLTNWNLNSTSFFSTIFIILISILGTIAFWLMYLDETKYKINWRKSTIRELLNNSNNNGNQNKKSLGFLYRVFYGLCFIAAVIIIFAYSFVGAILFKNTGLSSNKKTYEIVQKLPSTDDTQAGIGTLKASIQVVILHHGSQVLLMNGEIDGNEAINPQEDMSSSTLVIDTSSYEFQEASKYRFYKKKFKKVSTSELVKEQQNQKTQESP